MKEIELSKTGKKHKGKFTALVDEEDFEWLNKYNWSVSNGKRTNYAFRRENGKFIYIHRVIMRTPDNLEVDHLDCDGLNNQKHNLKNCTRKENANNPNALKHYSKSQKQYLSKPENRKMYSESRKRYYSKPENLKKHIEALGGITDQKVWQKIRIEYENGKNTYELAKEYDIDHGTVASYIIKAGGKLRKRGGVS